MKFRKHLRTSCYLFLCLCFVGSLNIQAQDCAKVSPWISKAESYAVGLDLNIMDAYTIMKLTSPAFHNEHFNPVFGKNYAELSVADKEKIRKQLLLCGKEKSFVAKGLVTGFDNGNMTASWDRQVAAINASSVEENDRIFNYESKIRARNNQRRQQQMAQQQQAYAQQRTASRSRGRSRRGVVTAQNPNAYNTSPKERVNTEADYKKEAAEMRPFLSAIKDNTAPTGVEFWDYNNRQLMEKVYKGNFEGFPIGLNDLQEQNLMGGFSKVNEIKKYERYLLIYLEYFSTHCASKTPSKYKKVTIQYEVIETKNHVSSSTGLTEPQIYYMKPYFEKDFRRIHSVLANSTGMDAIWMLASGGETGLDFEPDLRTLFGKYSCDASMIKQFETNLYLASKGKSSLQKLLPYHR